MEFHDRMNAKIAGMNIQGYRTSHGRGLLLRKLLARFAYFRYGVTVLCLVVILSSFYLHKKRCRSRRAQSIKQQTFITGSNCIDNQITLPSPVSHRYNMNRGKVPSWGDFLRWTARLWHYHWTCIGMRKISSIC